MTHHERHTIVPLAPSDRQWLGQPSCGEPGISDTCEGKGILRRILRIPFKGEMLLTALTALLFLDYMEIWTPGWGPLLNVLLYGVLFTVGTGLVCIEKGTAEAENFLGKMLLIELKGSIILGVAALMGGVAYPLFLLVRELLG